MNATGVEQHSLRDAVAKSPMRLDPLVSADDDRKSL
jgi:hypothetical protein